MPYAPKTAMQIIKASTPNYDGRPSAAARGYDRRWRKVRTMQLGNEPMCADCPGLATEVHHVVPLSQGGSRLDLANLMSLCKSCHSRRTGRGE